MDKSTIPPSHKYCPVCKTAKSRTEFNKNRSRYDGISSLCKPCQSVSISRCPSRYYVKHTENFRLNDYEKMLELQEGKCAICNNPPNTERLAVDHCHITNKIRGLLCKSCNIGIGWLKDSATNARNAWLYLERHNTVP
jgi:hypothetical protein